MSVDRQRSAPAAPAAGPASARRASRRRQESRRPLAIGGRRRDPRVVTIDWLPDRGIRRTVRTLAASGVTLVAAGAVLDAMWLLGIGVWGVIAALGIEIVYRP